MPAGCKGRLTNISVNGSTAYYPDGAVILEADAEIDGLFIARAANTSYFSTGTMFFLDTEMDAEAVCKKDMRFAAKKIVIAESLWEKLISRFDENAELVRVPDGTRLVRGDFELKPKTIKKYGSRLCAAGSVRILDGEALSGLEYLYVGGTVSLDKALRDEFDELESVYSELQLIDPKVGLISDRPVITIGAATLRRYPCGLRIRDCARVTLTAELTPDEIMDKLSISDCAVVRCTKEQEEAVNVIAEDVAMIKTGDEGDEDEGLLGGLFGRRSDTQCINAAEIKL